MAISLDTLAGLHPRVARVLQDATLGHTAAANSIGSGVHVDQVRRWRKKNGVTLHTEASEEAHPTTPHEDFDSVQKGTITVDSDSAEVKNVVVSEPILSDWSHIFAQFNLNPDEFEVVDDTVRMSTWQQSKRLENGQRDIVQLYSYSARFRRLGVDSLDARVVDTWRASLVKDRPTTYANLNGANEATYTMFVADPQLGKKGTEEAVANWKRGVRGHVERIFTLIDQGRAPEAVHVGWMGDEVEGVANNYCVDANERILTRDMQWVRAGDLKVGDRIYAVEEEPQSPAGRRYESGEVTANHVETMQARQVFFSDGTSLICTPNHPLLSKRFESRPYTWVEADDLQEGDQVVKVVDVWANAHDDYDSGWMGGFLDGEGCLQSAAGRDPWHLNVSQLPGPVLDKAKGMLEARGFRYREEAHENGVHVLHLLGGYEEVLRCLGAFRPVRLLAKVGHPYLRNRKKVTVVRVEDAGLRPIARLSTSARTYISEGVVSHNTNQPHTIELNQSKQMELDFDLRVWTLRTVASLNLPISASSVISNHGEWTRNGTKDVVTTRNDNASTYVARQVKKLFDEVAHFGGPKIDWTIGEDRPGIVVTLSGRKAYMSHGYVEKGRGGSTEIRTRNAIERQILGRTEELIDVPLYFMAHYHHAYFQEFEGRTQFGLPALEAERSSEYMLDQYGVWSPAGMLGLLVGNHTSRGWSDLAVC